MNLIIVESPTKAKTLSRYIGSSYRIEATMGHVRDLPEKKLGIYIKARRELSRLKMGQNRVREKENMAREKYQFVPDYQIIPDRRARIAELRKFAQNSGSVILATDPDREGEAIAWHAREILKSSTSRTGRTSSIGNGENSFTTFTTSSTFPTFKRIVFHEITESAIKHALSNPRDIDMHLVDAQQARRVLDRLVGYKLSPLLWSKLGKRWLSAGRVQSVAVRLIVDREREIEAFKSEEYWVIDVELEKSKLNGEMDKKSNFVARLSDINGKKSIIKNGNEAEKIVSDLKESIYKISDIEVKDSRRFPPPPFITSTLQQAGVNRFGWSAKRVMRCAQLLFEKGYITYHRTDSTNLSLDAINTARSYIKQTWGKDYLPQIPKFYKTKSKVAQEAHEAIRPTDVRVKSEKIKVQSDIGREAGMLYELIWKRFLSCQMSEAVIEQTNVEIESQKDNIIYLLKAQGERMKFDGWLVLYNRDQRSKIKDQKQQSENNNLDEEQNKELPELKIDEKLNLREVIPLQKFTEPPARYTEGTLIKALEEKGIGRPSTYAPILSTIEDRKYAEKIERKFHPTDLGKSVNDFLVKHFPDIFAVGFTARMEDELDEIANGKMDWEKVVSDFYSPFYSTLERVFKEADRVKIDLGSTDEKCPDCGSSLTVRLSKYGKFLACTNFPKCKFTKNIVEKAGISCPKCGGDIIVKKTRRGKQFYGCSNYPKCTFAVWKKEDIK